MDCKVVYGFFNLVNQESTEISATNENSFFPTSNLKDPRSTKVFRSTLASDSVVFDFKTSEPVDMICVRPDMDSGFSLVGDLTIEANFVDNWTSPPFSTTLTPETELNFGLKILETAENYRFWRVSGSGSSYFELSNLFIGSGFQAGKNASLNWNYANPELYKSTSNKFGQSFFNRYGNQKQISFSVKKLTSVEQEDFRSNIESVGDTIPVWIIMDNMEKFSTDAEDYAGMFYMKSPKYRNIAFGYWDTSVSLKEVK